MPKRYVNSTDNVSTIKLCLPNAMIKELNERATEQGHDLSLEIQLRLARSLVPDPEIAAENRAMKAFMKKMMGE